jgi:serine/threonine protein kinase
MPIHKSTDTNHKQEIGEIAPDSKIQNLPSKINIDFSMLDETHTENLGSLKNLFETFPRQKIFNQNIPYQVGDKTIQLSHSLVIFNRKKSRQENQCKYGYVAYPIDKKLGQGMNKTAYDTLDKKLVLKADNTLGYLPHKNPKIILKENIKKKKQSQLIEENDFLQKNYGDGRDPITVVYNNEEKLTIIQQRKIIGTNVAEYLQNDLSVDERLKLFHAIMNAYHKKCHQLSIYHLDIKPENILYNPNTGEANFIDFGKAKKAGAEWKLGETATAAYMAPELLHATDISKADIYSLGCTLNEVLGDTTHESRKKQFDIQYLSLFPNTRTLLNNIQNRRKKKNPIEDIYSPISSIEPEFPDEIKTDTRCASLISVTSRMRAADPSSRGDFLEHLKEVNKILDSRQQVDKVDVMIESMAIEQKEEDKLSLMPDKMFDQSNLTISIKSNSSEVATGAESQCSIQNPTCNLTKIKQELKRLLYGYKTGVFIAKDRRENVTALFQKIDEAKSTAELFTAINKAKEEAYKKDLEQKRYRSDSQFCFLGRNTGTSRYEKTLVNAFKLVMNDSLTRARKQNDINILNNAQKNNLKTLINAVDEHLKNKVTRETTIQKKMENINQYLKNSSGDKSTASVSDKLNDFSNDLITTYGQNAEKLKFDHRLHGLVNQIIHALNTLNRGCLQFSNANRGTIKP